MERAYENISMCSIIILVIVVISTVTPRLITKYGIKQMSNYGVFYLYSISN